MISLDFERQHPDKIIAGVDEVGRGPLAGPVVAAAVIIKSDILFKGVNDSKKVTLKKRELLYNQITSNYEYAIGQASVNEIEEFNILGATKLAIQRAVNKLKIIPGIVLVDGNMKFENESYISIIKGDQLSYSIAAASIIAKVYRDNLMKNLASEYPCYNWDRNAGYGTKAHIEAIKQFGATIHHRQSFIKNIKNA